MSQLNRKPALRERTACAALALALMLLAGPRAAHATVSWTIDIEDGFFGFALPMISITNNSDAGEQISLFTFNLNNPANYFDYVLPWGGQTATEAATGATLLPPGERTNDGVGPSSLTWSFDDFDPGETLSFISNVEPFWDGGLIDTREVFFGNGPGAPPADVLIQFSTSGGDLIDSIVLVGGTNDPSYTFSGGSGAVPVPEPGSAAMLALGLLGLGLDRRRKRGA